MLCELETDKVTVEVPSPAAGTLAEIVVAEGATVGVDALLATIAEGAAAAKRNRSQRRRPKSTAPRRCRPGAAAPAGTKTIDVMVPTLGESVTEATVASWFKAVGDAVAQDEMLCELETDKVSVEVPPPLPVFWPKFWRPKAPRSMPRPSLRCFPQVAPRLRPLPRILHLPHLLLPGRKNADVEDAPSAKKMMAEHGLSADQVAGTGKDGRIMKEDVQKALATPAAPTRENRRACADPARAGGRRRRGARRAGQDDTASPDHRRRLKDAQNSAAMLTTYNEVDMSAVMGCARNTRSCSKRNTASNLASCRSSPRPAAMP